MTEKTPLKMDLKRYALFSALICFMLSFFFAGIYYTDDIEFAIPISIIFAFGFIINVFIHFEIRAQEGSLP